MRDVKHFLSSAPLVRGFLLEAGDAAWETVKNCSINTSFFKFTLKAYLAMESRQDFVPASSLLEAPYRDKCSARQLAYILDRHPIFSAMPDRIALLSSPETIKQVLAGQYDMALAALPQAIDGVFAEKPDAAGVLTQLGLILAALSGDHAYYIFFLKCELEVLGRQGKYAAFRQKWEELAALLPEDPDLQALSAGMWAE
jgi:hypothetical protein